LDWGLVAKIDAQEADEPIRTLRRLLFGLQVGWLLIGGSLALLLAQRFASPIVQMVGGVKEIGRGNLGVRVPDGCADEIGELGRAFNQMADDLQNSRVRLEERVAERTGELARANSELQEALARVKTLSGLVPICTWCKKVRDDNGSWNQVEIYVERHSEAQFSHGVCPDCHEQLMADTQRPPESTQS
jgi:nitrate/nitrite-specific signal transduction histidine kinase